MKKNSFRIITMILLVALFLTGCGDKTTVTDEPVGLTAGTYVGEAEGMNGPVKLEVTTDDSKIEKIEIKEHSETPGVSDGAIEQMPERIVDNQSLNVDVVSGATMTSNAILAAAEEALIKAGADINLFKVAVEVESNEKTQAPDEKTEIVVVGAGAGGFGSSIEAGRLGKEVVLLEKMPVVGGSTILSEGYLWSSGSKMNKEHEVGFEPEAMKEYLISRGQGQVNVDLINKMVDISGEVYDTLIDEGLDMSTEFFPGGNPYVGLMVFGHSELGPGFISDLRENAESKGVDIRVNSEVVELIVEDNAVKGVVVETEDTRYNLYADKVILSTGGHTRNKELIEKYAPTYIDAYPTTGMGSTGDGYTMTEVLGAQVVGSGVFGTWGFNGEAAYKTPEGIAVVRSGFVVNQEGKRFMKEMSNYNDIADTINAQTGNIGYSLFDSNFSDLEGLESGIERGNTVKADTLEELAEKTGIDKEALLQEVDKYNKAFENGEDAEFGLENARMTPLTEGPFYMVKFSPECLMGSFAGLKVNADCQILGENDEPIENLYGAGELIFGNIVNDQYPTCGAAIGAGIYGGAIAARSAAK